MKTVPSKGRKAVGKFNVEFEIANNGDLEMVHRRLLPADQVRRQAVTVVVDPGAAMLVLPPSVVKSLGLRLKGNTRVRYSDHRSIHHWSAERAPLPLPG